MDWTVSGCFDSAMRPFDYAHGRLSLKTLMIADEVAGCAVGDVELGQGAEVIVGDVAGKLVGQFVIEVFRQKRRSLGESGNGNQ